MRTVLGMILAVSLAHAVPAEAANYTLRQVKVSRGGLRGLLAPKRYVVEGDDGFFLHGKSKAVGAGKYAKLDFLPGTRVLVGERHDGKSTIVDMKTGKEMGRYDDIVSAGLRTRTTGGVALNLSVDQKVIAARKGNIWVLLDPATGARIGRPTRTAYESHAGAVKLHKFDDKLLILADSVRAKYSK